MCSTLYTLLSTYSFHEVINDAEAKGILRPHVGSRIFEGTVGSTGISIATVAAARYVLRNHRIRV